MHWSCLSGSTLTACEKTSRHVRLFELDRRYCDVVTQRWQEFTGTSANLEEDVHASQAA